MSYPVFMVPAGDVLPIFFGSYAGSTGASSTISGLAVTDIEIYKDGGTTQRASDAGYTLLDTDGIDVDGLTGINGFSIDTGDNTDAGFYTVGAWFTVVVSAITVDSQTVSFVAAQFRLIPAESVAGKPKVDTDTFGGTAGTFASGRPEVNATHISGDSGAADNIELAFEDSARYIRKGTAQAGDTTNITLDASASAVDDFYNGCLIHVVGGTGVNQARVITDYVGATKVATVGEAWGTNPSSDSVFIINPGGNAEADVNVTQWAGAAVATPTTAGVPEVDVTHVAGAAVSTSSAQIGVNVVNAGGTAWGSGAITSATFAAGAIDAAAIAADAIGASELAAGAVDEILDEQLTDSIPADGTLPTVRQALYMLTQFMLERAVSGTTVTVKKADGSTSLFTLTLNDATNPTSITRAS
jgi:hypothetical protein